MCGYVIHKLHKKLKNSKSYKSTETQLSVLILESCREENIAGQENQKLLSALNRGRLWYTSTEVQQIFVIAEKYFLKKTGNKPIKTIKIKEIITDITNFSYVADFFGVIVSKIEANTDVPDFGIVAKKTLFDMAQLYIRVRMFSLVRDFVQNQRVSKSKRNKEKSLRRSLKKAVREKVSSFCF